MRVSLRDLWFVARMQLFRASRSRAFLALCSVHVLVAAGSAWVFTRILLELERAAALALSVPPADKPGTMLEALRDRGDLLQLVNGLVQDEQRAQALLDEPLLALTSFWLGLGTVPFLAAAAGSEAISPDLAPRTLRFEAVRTGRLEIAFGRLLAQTISLGAATLLSVVGPFLVAMFAMVQQPVVGTLLALLSWTPRLFFWALPFVGLGVAISMLSASAQLVRVLALGATALTWVLYGLLLLDGLSGPTAEEPWHTLSIVGQQLLPQGWLSLLWAPRAEAWPVLLVFPAMALSAAGGGFLFFRGRDL